MSQNKNQKIRTFILTISGILLFALKPTMPQNIETEFAFEGQAEAEYEELMFFNKKDIGIFGCPRYLLGVSSSMGAADTESSIKLANIAKRIAGLIKQELMASRLKPEAPKLKEDILSYMDACVIAADAFADYLTAGNQKEPFDLDKYFSDKKNMDNMVLYDGLKADGDIWNTALMICPCSILTVSQLPLYADSVYSEKGRVSIKEGITCEDCAKIAGLSKDINLIYEKLIDEEYREKWSPYFKAMDAQIDAFVNYYRTGDKKFMAEAYKYRKEALVIAAKIWH